MRTHHAAIDTKHFDTYETPVSRHSYLYRTESTTQAQARAATKGLKCYRTPRGVLAYFVFKFMITHTMITARMPNIVTAVGLPRSAHLVSHPPLNWKRPISHSEH